MTVYVSAPSNIALVKYWGKRDTQRNLPLTSSFSVTLSKMRSWAAITPIEGPTDQWEIMGNPKKAQRVLDIARSVTQDHRPLRIKIQNDFPSGAGLASSASSMAALAFGVHHALQGGDQQPLTEVARWARLGSGSAVRSLYPGYVLWEAGANETGDDCVAQSRFPTRHFPLALVVCVINDQPKPIGSTAAMERCRDTSPNYEDFHTRNPEDLRHAMQAVEGQDISALGQVSEANCLAMHDVMHKASPPVDYFMPGTHAAIACVRQLRQDGVPCFFTIDAGPNVKVLCPPTHRQVVSDALSRVEGVKRLLQDQVSDQAARREEAWPDHLTTS